MYISDIIYVCYCNKKYFVLQSNGIVMLEKQKFVENIVSMYSSQNHILFLKTDGKVLAMGNNEQGQLGVGDNVNKISPTKVIGISDVVQISVGHAFSLFLRADGTVYSCGHNFFGQLGHGYENMYNQNIPTQILKLENIVKIACGYHHSLFLRSDGKVLSCGYNLFGQIGIDHTKRDRSFKIIEISIDNIISICASDHHSIFLKSDGTVWVIGKNEYGIIGFKDPFETYTPIRIPRLENIISIDTGDRHSVFLDIDGNLWVSGHNIFSKIVSTKKNTIYYTPTQIGDIKNVRKVSITYDLTVVITTEKIYTNRNLNI